MSSEELPLILHASPFEMADSLFVSTLQMKGKPLMSKYPTWNFPVDTQTLLVLAWFSTFDLRALLQRKQQEQPWKNPLHLLEDILRSCIDDALARLQGDPIYGPALLRLAHYRMSRVRLQHVASAISLEALANPSNALFFSDDPYQPIASQMQQESEPENETEAFREAVALHVLLVEHLQRLSQTWKGDVCRGACDLHAFFLWYLETIQRPLRVPFFLNELLRTSLMRVDWH